MSLEGRSGSFDSGLAFICVILLVSGDHQLLLDLLLPVPVCVGHVDLPMLLGLLEFPPLRRGHLDLHHWEHDLMSGGCGEYI